MRVTLLLPALFAAGLAAAPAAAQEEDPPADAPQEEERRSVIDAVTEALDEVDSGAEAEPETEPEPEPEAEPEAEPAEEAAAAPPEPVVPAPPLTAEEFAAVEETAARGRLLAETARAGMLTTSDMLGRIADPEEAGIVGWIAEREGNAVAVTYYAEGEDGPVAVYRGRVLGPRVVSRDLFAEGERPELTAAQARLAAARAAAVEAGHESCGGAPLNHIVLPPEGPDAPVHVYSLTAPTEAGRFPFGGHYRTSVGAGGEAEVRAMARGCPVIEAPVPEEGQRPEPIGITHLLDPAPTEVHVFLSRLTGRPLLVATGEPARLWLVTGEEIAELRN